MKTQRLLIALTVCNLGLLAFVLAQVEVRFFGLRFRPRPVEVNSVGSVLRGRALEIVDDHGRVRSRLVVKPGSEVVELQLYNPEGIIQVKLGAGASGSGIFLGDETRQSGVQIIARQTGTPELPKTTSITLTSKDGQERLITP